MRQEQISTRRTHLSATKLSLLAKRLQGKTSTGAHPDHSQIGRAPHDSELPLTQIQEDRLLYEQRVRETTGRDVSNHLSKCFWLRGRLDEATLAQSLESLSQRHDILRTRFLSINGRLTQVITDSPVIPLSVIDLRDILRDISGDEREQAAMERVGRQEHEPFDIKREVLWRVVLFRLGEEEYLMLLTMHHVISDTSSMEFMVRDLLVFYRACSTSAAALLPALPIQFADYAHWQRSLQEGSATARQLSYWKEQLKGMGPLPDVHFRNMRPVSGTISDKGTARRIALSAELIEPLRELGRREGCTLYMVILAAVKILLHHCSGQEDIGVRSPVSGRSRPETEGMVGWLANLLVLRTDFQGVVDFADALRRVRKVVLEAYEHQEIPFVMLVEVFNHSSKWNDDTPRVVFNMTQKRGDQKQTPQIEGLKILSVAVPRPAAVATNGLAIQVVESDRELDISITYRAEAFEATAVTAMLSGLRVILESAVADPHLKFPELLSSLPT